MFFPATQPRSISYTAYEGLHKYIRDEQKFTSLFDHLSPPQGF